MSQHRQATDPGPSRISVATTFLAAVGSAAETFWILSGPGDDPRHLAGGITAFAFTLMLVARWARLEGERETVRRRAQLEQRAADRRAAHEAWEAAMAMSASDPDPVATQPIEPVSASEPDPLDLARPYVPVMRPEDAATEVFPRVAR
jgi:hypothetical protein